MSLTKVVIALGGLLAVLFGYVTIFNRDDTSVVLWSGMTVELPMSVLILACVFFGALFVLILVGTTELGSALRSLQQRRQHRREAKFDQLYRRGCDAYDLGHIERAIVCFERVLERNRSHVPSLIQLGRLHRSEGNTEAAVQLHKRALERDPENLRLLVALAEDFLAVERWQEALEIFKRVLEVDVEAPVALLNMRDLQARLERFDEAIETQRQIDRRRIEGGDDKTALRRLQFQQAVAHLDQGKSDVAKKGFADLIKQDRRFTPAYVEWGRLLIGEGKEKDGMARWRDGYSQTGEMVFLHLLEQHYLKKEDPDSAIGLYLGAIKDAPARACLQFNLGKLYFRLEMLDNAYETLRDLLDAGTDFPAAHQLYGEVLHRRGECEAAFKEFQHCLPFPNATLLPYRCRQCGEEVERWSAQCEACNAWQSLRLPVEECQE